jgi:hypothetical protein
MRTAFTKDTITIQPQARACMEKEHVSFAEVLETLNEWESGDVQCSNIAEMMRITEYPETEDAEHILTFCDMEKDIADRRISVTYSTSFEEHAGKTRKYATVHWISVMPRLAESSPTDQPHELSDPPAAWLKPRSLS